VFAICCVMKYPAKMRTGSAAVFAICLLAALVCGTVPAQEKVVKQIADSAQPVVSPADKRTIKGFEGRVKRYVQLRERMKGQVPKLFKDSTPEQIAAFEKASVEALRAARADARPGDMFTVDISQFIRTMLKREFKGPERQELRKVVLDNETGSPVPLKINYPYPDPKEFAEMPPSLLLKLPQLPKQVKYRYVGRNLMLVDSDNNLIIDYMLDALP
jgi:hypothetical protein